MKTARLKNIIILILVLFNAFLLVLLFSQQVQQRSVRSRSKEQLQQLFAASNLSIADQVFSVDENAANCSVFIDTVAQESFSSALLGETSASESGGMLSYEGDHGSCQFRANGSVEASFSNYFVENPLLFCEKLFKEYGYAILAPNLAEAQRISANGTGSIIGTRVTENGTIYNATISFSFSGKKLTAVSGTLLTSVETVGPYDGIGATTALVNFLDYYNAGGLVCTEVTDLQHGYLLQGFASGQLKLAPVWYIETDVSNYYVDLMTGEVSRA